MKTWIDHTGLHGAGRCLAGQATLDEHLRGLLQLATLLVFSDTLSFSAFEPPHVAETGEQSRAKVVSLGLHPESLIGRHITGIEYARACTEAAELAASEWPDHFFRTKTESFGGHFDRPMGAKAVMDAKSILAARDFRSQEDAYRLLETEKAAGAIRYMLGISSPLRNAVAMTISQCPKWGSSDSYQLESFLRSILNNQLAKQVGQTYVPAASRAEQLARESHVLCEQVEQGLKGMAGRWRPKLPSLPRLSLTLVRRAKGDPAGIISAALEMREKTQWLRSHLGHRLAEISRDPYAPDYEPKEKAEFERYARSLLGLELEPRVIDAIEIKIVLGLPIVNLSGAKLYDWAMYRCWKRRLIVLTDLAHARPFDGLDERHFQTFVDKATGRNRPKVQLPAIRRTRGSRSPVQPEIPS